MELYNLMKNLRALNREEEIKTAIEVTKQQLNTLTEERTCFIYSSYMYEELKNKHIPCRIISTNDLGYEYEHRFVLIPNNEEENNYYLIDLTFSQFPKNGNVKQLFKPLIENGYQILNDDLWFFYLDTITGKIKGQTISLEAAFYNQIKNQQSIK